MDKKSVLEKLRSIEASLRRYQRRSKLNSCDDAILESTLANLNELCERIEGNSTDRINIREVNKLLSRLGIIAKFVKDMFFD